jgi:hypothetical protein
MGHFWWNLEGADLFSTQKQIVVSEMPRVKILLRAAPLIKSLLVLPLLATPYIWSFPPFSCRELIVLLCTPSCNTLDGSIM